MPNKKNYTNYNNKFQGSREAVKPVDEAAVVEPIIEEEVTETVEATEEVVETVEETVTEPVEEDTITMGLIECKNKLNVRKFPKKDAGVLCEIPNGSKVQVDLKKSTLEWYHVITPEGIEGFCMKNFVAIK